MAGAEALGDQLGQVLPDQFGPRVTEQLLGLSIHQDNLPTLIDHHNGIRCRFEEAAELRIGLAPQRHVANPRRGRRPGCLVTRWLADRIHEESRISQLRL